MRNLFLKKQAAKFDCPDISLREQPVKEDCEKVYRLLSDTGFFSEEEIDTAIELIEEKISLGEGSSYRFLFAGEKDTFLGYSCYGLIPLTKASYDLYWIAVDTGKQGRGIGRFLLSRTEALIKASGGCGIYVDTSSREQYLPTRKFYLSSGYRKASYYRDFYSPGDGKIVFYKKLS